MLKHRYVRVAMMHTLQWHRFCTGRLWFAYTSLRDVAAKRSSPGEGTDPCEFGRLRALRV